uniref:Uncharacterized protein n=1 Tax=Chrysotila carterae TaxID=13221 RepID=A0A7S4B2J4_CHRCT
MATALRLMGSSYVLQFFGCSLIFCAFAHADSSCEPYLTATSLIEAASRQELTLATFPEAHRNVPNLTYVQTSLVTFGSAPPPRAASNVGQSDVLVCAANQGYSLAGLQSQLVQTINGLLYGNPTGSGLGVVSDESTCLERINGQQAFAAESEENSDAMATQQLPPPVYLYAHTYNTRNRSLTVRVSRPSGETGAGDLVLQTVLRGEPDTNVYEFGEDGTLLGAARSALRHA